MGDMGVNYMLDDYNSIGLKYTVTNPFKVDRDMLSHNLSTVDGVYDDELESSAIGDYDLDWEHQLNAYYNGRRGKVEIDFNADYFQNGSKQEQVTEETSATAEDRSVHALSHVKNQLAAGKLSLAFPLGGGKLLVGSEVTYTNRDDDYVNLEEYVPTTYSQIKEMNAAGFAEYQRSFPWGDWTVGLRYEHVKFDYFEDEVRIDEQSQTFDNFFPTVSFSTQFGPVQMNLNYTSKTQRPTYSQLSNTVIYIDRYTMQSGDPTLRPSIAHEVSLTGAWRFLQLNMSYRQTKDQILYWGGLEEDGSQLMIRDHNWDDPIRRMLVFLSASPTIGCWSPVLSIGMQKQWLTVESNGSPYRLNRPIYMATFNNTWKLPWELLLSLDSSVFSKGDSGNYSSMKAFGSVDVSLRKSFLKDALSVEVRGSDLFDTNKQNALIHCNYYTLHQQNSFDNREFSLTVRYKFNATRSKYKGTGAGASQKSRM